MKLNDDKLKSLRWPKSYMSSALQKQEHLLPGPRLELSYLHGGQALYKPGEMLGPRELFDFELVYVIEGHVIHEVNGIKDEIPPGGFIISRPEITETYHWDPDQRTRHAFIHFAIETYPHDWPDPFTWPQIGNTLNPLSVGLFRHIVQNIYNHDSWAMVRPSEAICRIVEVLIDTLLESPHVETASFERDRPEPVHLALMHIRTVAEEDPFHPLTLTELADQANVTEKYLCRLFSKWVGSSPMRTFTLLKLQSSLPLLARTNLSIQEVASRCGFENPFYFTRLFKKTYNYSPRAFRERLAQGELSLPSALPNDIFPRIRW